MADQQIHRRGGVRRWRDVRIWIPAAVVVLVIGSVLVATQGGNHTTVRRASSSRTVVRKPVARKVLGPPADKRGASLSPAQVRNLGPAVHAVHATYDEPRPVSCGAWAQPGSRLGRALAAPWGGFRDCLLVHNRWWVFATDGSGFHRRGVVGVQTCPNGSCRPGLIADSVKGWRLIAAPHHGGVSVLALAPRGGLIVANDGDELQFDPATGAFGRADSR